MQKLRVLVTSSSPHGASIVQALRENTSFEVLEASISGLMEKLVKFQPDVLILEEIEGEDPLPLIAEVRKSFPFVAPVLLARELRGRDACLLQRAGLAACFPLRWPPRRIAEGVSLAATRDAFYISPAFKGASRDSQDASLSPREREILSLLAAKLKNREIAQKLFLAEGTVKIYTHRLFKKLGVRNRTEAVAWALRHGILSDISTQPRGSHLI